MRIYMISPFRGKTRDEEADNFDRAQAICRAIVLAGHTPFASHLFFPLFLSDSKPEERQRGIDAGHDLMIHGGFERAWFYPARGEEGVDDPDVITEGMQADMDAAEAAGIKLERGTIGGDI